MATTIVPALGHAPLLTQQGTGTSPGYDAIDIRRIANGGMQEGVLNASDFMVVQRAAGANMSVDVGMPAGGLAYVQGDTVSGQGLYPVPVHSATINQTLTAANATNPRIDQIVVRLFDNVHDASGSNVAQIDVLTGTATAGATLANRTGALALPGNALLLADVLVGAAATTVDNTKIRDRRKWARGAFSQKLRTGGNYSVTSITMADIDATNINVRVECSGAPVRMTMSGRAQNGTNAVSSAFRAAQDGVAIDSAGDQFLQLNAAAFGESWFNLSYLFTPGAGSHLLGWQARVSSTSTLTIFATTGVGLTTVVEELVRQNTANNTTTTG